MRVIKDGEGTVLQRFDYYPFGSESRVWTAGTSTLQSALRYRFCGKEIAGQKVSVSTGAPAAAAGSPYLDFGARVYDPRTAAWLSQDPLSEKYYSISPYAYCAGNPVNIIDPDGTHNYYFTKDGHWQEEDTEDNFDLLISESGEELYVFNRNIMGKMKEGKFLYEISGDLDLKELPLHYSVFEGNNPEALSVFKFLSDNTSVEWLLYNGSNGQALLATNHLSGVVDEYTIKTWVSPISDIMEKDPIWKIHNHPRNSQNEISDMAHDKKNTIGHPSLLSYVYYSGSGNIYLLRNNKILSNIKWGTLLKHYR